MRFAAILAVAALLTPAGTALAQSCAAQVAELAEREGLQPAVPTDTADAAQSGSLTDALKDSGGVIAPPSTGTTPVIEPPSVAEGMQTAPPVMPDSEVGLGGADGQDSAALQAQAESLLGSAIAADQGGDAGLCLERLAEAERVMEALAGQQ